VGPKGGWGN
jgi:hypothetical protein